MHNVWLIAKREYLERVRTKAFIIFTILVPLIFGSLGPLSGKLVSIRSGKLQKLVLVTDNPQFADAFKESLAAEDKSMQTRHGLTVDRDVSDTHVAQLTSQVGNQQVSSYLLASNQHLSQGDVDFRSENVNDFIEIAAVKSAVVQAARNMHLLAKGFSRSEIQKLLKPLRMQTTAIRKGKTGVIDAGAMFTIAFIPTILLFVSVMMHGINVMRSILEEKNSRVMEVMLSAVTAKEMMAGKIVGVGAVGITQLLIWFALGAAAAAPMIAAAGGQTGVHIEAAQIILFAILFLLGFVLYSGIYAAIGAMVNSEQEAQQIQFVAMLPLIFAYVFALFVIRMPNAPVSVALSMFPLFAPLLMMARIMTGAAPPWQIASALVLLLAAIYGVLIVTSRIYRVGILMYGKRPTLPEIVRWIRYAY